LKGEAESIAQGKNYHQGSQRRFGMGHIPAQIVPTQSSQVKQL
jgi:hypothetical protein